MYKERENEREEDDEKAGGFSSWNNVAASLSGCGSQPALGLIITLTCQSETHPEHLGLLAFKEYVEEKLGDKYEVQIFPNELLGSLQKAIELTQTRAIDFMVVIRQT